MIPLCTIRNRLGTAQVLLIYLFNIIVVVVVICYYLLLTASHCVQQAGNIISLVCTSHTDPGNQTGQGGDSRAEAQEPKGWSLLHYDMSAGYVKLTALK